MKEVCSVVIGTMFALVIAGAVAAESLRNGAKERTDTSVAAPEEIVVFVNATANPLRGAPECAGTLRARYTVDIPDDYAWVERKA